MQQSPLPSPQPLPGLLRADYPNAKYWDKKEWLAEKDLSKGETTMAGPRPRGSTRASQGINVAMQYIGDMDGSPVDGHRATTIRNTANQIFFQFQTQGIAPEKWGQAGVDIHGWYNTEMARQIPEMRLCADSWKAQHLATHMYSSWYNTHGRTRKPVVKAEGGEDQRLIVETTRGQKRKGPSPLGRKRVKVDSEGGIDMELEIKSLLPVYISHVSYSNQL